MARLINYRRACPTIDAAVGAYNVADRLQGLAALLRGDFRDVPFTDDTLSGMMHFVADTLDDCAARLGTGGERADERVADYYRVLLRPPAPATEAAR